MHTRILSFAVALCASVPGLLAAPFEYQGLWFEPIDDTNTCAVVSNPDYNFKYQGEVVIPATANGYAVTRIKDNAFSYCEELTSVTLPASVTEIYMPVFSSSPKLASINVDAASASFTAIDGNLYDKDVTTLVAVKGIAESIDLPESVIRIGGYAAQLNRNFTEMTQGGHEPYQIQEIGELAFWNTGIKRFSSYATIVGAEAFEGCADLESISLPALEAIPNRLCNWCKSLRTININSAVSIDFQAFASCESLESVTLPFRVESLGEQAFADNRALKFVDFGRSLTEIGENAFRNCTGLRSIQSNIAVPPANVAANAFEGASVSDCILFTEIPDAYRNVAPWNGFKKVMTNKFVKDGAEFSIYVDSPQYGAFFKLHDSAVSSYDIPAAVSYDGLDIGVKTIFGEAFKELPSLQKVTVPSSIESIWQNAFTDCPALTDVVMVDGLYGVSNFAFNGCNALTHLSLPATVEAAYSIARNCNALTSIDVAPANDIMFSEDGVLYLRKNEMNPQLLYSVPTGLEKVAVLPGTTGIQPIASLMLKEIDFPESMENLGNYLRECPALTSISCRSVTPPMLAYRYGVAEEVYQNATVYVPVGALDNYRNNDAWGQFVNIQEKEFESSITEIAADGVTVRVAGGRIVVDGADSATVYDLSGRPAYQGPAADLPILPAGVYIVKAADTVAKVVL